MDNQFDNPNTEQPTMNQDGQNPGPVYGQAPNQPVGNGQLPPNQGPANNYQYNVGGYQEEPQGNGMATASLVLGIVSAVLLCCAFPFNCIAAIIGIILGFVSKKGAERLSGNAKAGIIISIIVLVLSVILLILGVFVFKEMMNDPELSSLYKQILEQNINVIFFR